MQKPTKNTDTRSGQLKDYNHLWDADEKERDHPPADPSTIRDEGILKSLGKAITSPVRDSEPEPASHHAPDERPGRTP